MSVAHLGWIEQVVERGHDADAHDVVMLRDVPEPAAPIAGLNHHRRAFVAPGVAIGALPIGPDGALVEHGIPEPQPESILQQGGLAAGIDDDLRADFSSFARGIANPDAGCPIPIEQHLEDVNAFVRLDAVLARVLEHHLVELAPDHLPGLRALVRLVVVEVERRGQPAAGIDELHAVLLDEGAGLHLRQHVQPLQHPVRLGNQRLADVEPGKPLALEQGDAHATLGEERRNGGAGGAAADHDDVVVRHLSWAVSVDAQWRCRSRRQDSGTATAGATAGNRRHISLRVTDAGMLGQEETLQQDVDPEQSLPGERQPLVGTGRQQAARGQTVDLVAKPDERIHAVLP